MPKITIYHNPRCSKSRQALTLLQEKKYHPEVIEYLKFPPTVKELTKLLRQLGIKPRELLRTSEPIYKELNLANNQLTDKELIEILSENPILIERPIVIVDDEAIIARPPEKLLDLL